MLQITKQPSVIWSKDGINYFELNKKTNKLWCNCDYVWKVFENDFNTMEGHDLNKIYFK